MTKNKINIQVSTKYLAEKSRPEQQRFVFSYTIKISNNSENTAQLLRRHWIIKDAEGGIEEVRGDGVIGVQPHIEPNTTYVYSSVAVLKTDVGTMEGEYEMIDQDRQPFMALIAPFTLSIPRVIH